MRQWGNGAIQTLVLASRDTASKDKCLYCLIAPLPHCPINTSFHNDVRLRLPLAGHARYSTRSASTGSIRVAVRAGQSPATKTTATRAAAATR